MPGWLACDRWRGDAERDWDCLKNVVRRGLVMSQGLGVRAAVVVRTGPRAESAS